MSKEIREVGAINHGNKIFEAVMGATPIMLIQILRVLIRAQERVQL